MSIWLDVTTILNWNRPALGIVRVESECARYFLDCTQNDIRFCQYDHRDSCYVEINRKYVEEALTRIEKGGGQRPSTAPIAVHPSVPTLSCKKRLERCLVSMMHRLPSKSREAAFRFARSRREVFFSVLRAYREMKFAFRTLIGPNGSSALLAPVIPRLVPTPDTQPPILKTADVYVSMGLDWDQKNLEHLYQLKQEFGFRVVFFCYDIIPVKLPHLCVDDVASAFVRYVINAAWCADKILCISDHSRHDLERFLREVGAPIPDLSVVRLGSEVPRKPGQLPSSDIADILRRRYILFVSAIERRKNHETLYRALSRLIDAGETDIPLLVFVGIPGWGVNDLLSDLRIDPRTQPYIRILNQVSDSDLSLLYEHCEFTVFPSLYEGWGFPVAESLAYGKFCLASSAASIPEVGGNLIEHLDPWDVPAWTERLWWYFSHPEAVAEKEAKIRLEYRPRGWDETGAFVLAAVKQLAAS